jgi:hypothetical protein
MKKKLKMFGIVISLLIIATVFSSCIHTPGGIAPSTTPINGRSYEVLGTSIGTNRVVYVLGIPFTSSNSFTAARDEAINRKGGDALIDVTTSGFMHFYVVVWTYTTSVQGIAIKFDDDSNAGK